MSFADLLPGRFGLGGRLPRHAGDLRGPGSGVIMLPRHLSWPGMRECDIGDEQGRRAVYAMLLTQGTRNDVARLVNPALLSQDWPLIRKSLHPRLCRWCERRFRLGRLADPAVGQDGTISRRS